jgi:hypothetical protein
MLVARTRPSPGRFGTVRFISFLTLLLSVLLSTAGLPAASAAPGTAAAEVAAADPDFTSQLRPNEGVRTRFKAVEGLYALEQAPPSKQALPAVQSAAGLLRGTLAHLKADYVTHASVLTDDAAAIKLLKTMGGQENNSSWISIGGDIVDADRIAAAREYALFTTLPDRSWTYPDGRTLTRAQVISEFETAYRRSREDQTSRDYLNAMTRIETAWTLVHHPVTSYWSANDPDGDLVVNTQEQALGTDPNSTDTDGDGLSDVEEVLTTMTDPASTMTYGGVRDEAADVDRDGLTTREELDAGSDPIDPDSDADGLLDGAEVDFSSDPSVADTDDDELPDASEKRVGTDPRDRDTDDNGVIDGRETYTTTLRREALGVELGITGVGDVASTVTVSRRTEVTWFEDQPGRLSHAVDFSTSREFGSADVTFDFDPSAVPGGDVENIAIAWYDEEAGALVPLPTRVVGGKATATTTHFTTFVLFYVPNWNAVFDAWDPGAGGGDPTSRSVDVVLSLDSSGSMSWNDPQGLRRTAAKSFVDGLIDGDRVGVVDFDDWGRLAQPLTGDLAAAKAAIDTVDDSGGTNIAAGVDVANRELISRSGDDRIKAEILLTDGDGYYDPALTQQAIDHDITIYTIGLGTSVNSALLEGIATATGGQYFAVAQASDLPSVFNRIGGGIGEGEDVDEDGLNDLHELKGMVTGTGLTIHTDPRDPDTDDDGLLDGDEVSLQRDWSAPYPVLFYNLLADPHDDDSDSDGLSDAEELDMGISAMIPDQDGDRVLDGTEYERGMDLFDDNPDGDQYDDAEEISAETNPFTYDPSLADRTRALGAGALLGELGYVMADNGIEASLQILYPLVGIPKIVPEVGGISECLLPFTDCEEITSFEPWMVDQAEYVVGMMVVSLVPFADIAAAIRDVIGQLLQGEWGWAIAEVITAAVGFAVPVAGDIPGIIAKVVKWLGRATSRGNKSDELLAVVASSADDVPAAEKFFPPLVKAVKGSTYDVLSRHMDDATIMRLVTGGQSLDDLATVINRADSVSRVGRWFDADAVRGRWGREAEDLVRSVTNGASRRIDTPIAGVGHFRIVDSLAGRVANEVKTGDGVLDDKMLVQITKDEYLLDNGLVDEVVWHFYPSARSNRVGPTPALLDELKLRGIEVRIYLP